MTLDSQILMSGRLDLKGKCEFHSPIESIMEYTDILQFKVVFVNLFLWKCGKIFNDTFTKLQGIYHDLRLHI